VPPMTLSNMRRNGVRVVIATWQTCDHKADVNVDALAPRKAMAAVPQRRSRAIPFNPLKPFDRHQFADRVMTRRSPATHLAHLHRVDHTLTQVLSVWLRIPAGLRPANRLNQNLPDSEIPTLDSSQAQDALGTKVRKHRELQFFRGQ
jgi:hypothetical protein